MSVKKTEFEFRTKNFKPITDDDLAYYKKEIEFVEGQEIKIISVNMQNRVERNGSKITRLEFEYQVKNELFEIK